MDPALKKMRALAEAAAIIGAASNMDTWPKIVIQLIDEIDLLKTEVERLTHGDPA